MTQNFKEMMNDRAAHEAGHVAAAERLSIPVRSVSIVEIESQPPGTRLAPLHEVCKFAEASCATRIRAEDYAVVRLAGPVAEMMNAALRAKRRGQTLIWSGWQADWREKLEREEDADFDVAFAISFAWSDSGDQDLLGPMNRLWDRAVEIVQPSKGWRKIRRLAECLLEQDVMTGAEAIAVLRKS